MKYDLDALIARQQVIDVINQLFIQTDNRNWLVVQQCFAEQVNFDMDLMSGGNPSILTPEQITEAWDLGLKDITAIHHQAGNYVIDVHGPDNAHALCYGIAYHYTKTEEEGEKVRQFVGTYEFDLERRGDLWKITTFWFTCKFIK